MVLKSGEAMLRYPEAAREDTCLLTQVFLKSLRRDDAKGEKDVYFEQLDARRYFGIFEQRQGRHLSEYRSYRKTVMVEL